MAAPGYVLKNRRTTLERAEKFISSKFFTDCNLRGRLYPKKAPVASIKHYAAPGRISYDEAMKGKYEDTAVGAQFGPTWSTHWFRVDLSIPEAWVGEEVHFLWNSNSEAMVWQDGVPLQGLTDESRRSNYMITKKLTKKQLNHTLYIEMACNMLFGMGDGYQIAPPIQDAKFALSQAELVVMDRSVYELVIDIEMLVGLAQHLPEDSNRGYQALYTANEMINIIDFSDRSTLTSAHDIAQKFFSEKNGESQFTVCAVGHCHIDSAWLWPYAETIRKCARSWSSTVRLMDEYPELTFACSQAQQFEWVQNNYPALFSKIKKYVGEGRFIPVGGAWVEMDGNMPSGEAFMRQFLYGQKYFERQFGKKCSEFWLPDTFGYSGQLPQILQLSGITRFLTQKLSWNLVNKFPHHTFWWGGIDGSKVLAHFPPGDSYNMNGEVEEVVRTIKNFRDKGRSNKAMYLYGFGDGGQGPTAEMMDRMRRLKDVDGCPKVEMSSPEEFFTHLEVFEGDQFNVWEGELFFELHNGTYTSQAKTKAGNRHGEFLLHDIEAVSTLATVAGSKGSGYDYPAEELLRLWKLLLLNQFHDVLPGSSIGEVYKDALAYYKDIRKSGTKLLNNAAQGLLSNQKGSKPGAVAINTQCWSRHQVVCLPKSEGSPSSKRRKNNETLTQADMHGNTLAFVNTPSMGYSVISSVDGTAPQAVSIHKKDEMIFIKNSRVEAVIDPVGRITELYVAGSKKNAICDEQYGNQLVIFDDVPLYWDAWDVMDYHLETRKALDEVIQHARIVEEGPLRAAVEVSVKISDESYVKQLISLDAESPYIRFTTEVEWHESHKFLKVEFPVNVHANQATYEIQCGHLQRPTRFNTSWDWAKFEVCGHKWADVSEYNFGVAVLNDSKYGWSCINNALRLSLLRSPKAPDEKADMGSQKFTYAVMPHQGSFQSAGVIQAAYDLNCPVQVLSVPLPSDFTAVKSYVSVDNPQVVLETLKMSEESPDAFVLRFYEAFGGTAKAHIKLNLPVTGVKVCNVLEEVLDEEVTFDAKSTTVTVTMKPFQILSLICACV